MKQSIIALITLCIGALCNGLVFAETLPIPRFVSLRAEEVNLRTGPNIRYPVRFVYNRKSEPVEIIAEFEQWRRIRDRQGDDGWVHESMLSGKRFVLINAPTTVISYKKPEHSSSAVSRLEPDVQAQLLECNANWCYINAQGYKGWVERKWLWGIYPNEIIR
jgi:SH3-like domain-containing protein